MGGQIQGPKMQASRPQMMQPTMMQGAPRQQSFFEKLLGAAPALVGMFNPVAGAALGAANSLMSGDAGGFAQNLQQATASPEQTPTEKGSSAVDKTANSLKFGQQSDTDQPPTPLDSQQQQAPMQQQPMPLWMYQDPMLMLMLRYGMLPGMGDFQGMGQNQSPQLGMGSPLIQLPPGYGQGNGGY